MASIRLGRLASMGTALRWNLWGTMLVTIMVTGMVTGVFSSNAHAQQTNLLGGYPHGGGASGAVLDSYSNGSGFSRLNIVSGSFRSVSRPSFGSYFVDAPHRAAYRQRVKAKQAQQVANANAPAPCGNYLRASKFAC